MAAPVEHRLDSTEKRAPALLDKVVNPCKRRGFVFPSGEIYGGTRSAWDYGPARCRAQGEHQEAVVAHRRPEPGRHRRAGLLGDPAAPDLGRLGHVGVFTDPLTECQSCHSATGPTTSRRSSRPEGARAGERPGRHLLPELRHQGRVDRAARLQHDAQDLPRPGRGRERLHYLRLETAQGIFVNFANVMGAACARSRRSASARSASRSATRSPRATSSSGRGSSSRWRWSSSSSPARRGMAPVPDRPAHQLVHRELKIDRDNLRLFEHPKEKLSHYSKRTVDIEYRFGFQGSEWGEP